MDREGICAERRGFLTVLLNRNAKGLFFSHLFSNHEFMRAKKEKRFTLDWEDTFWKRILYALTEFPHFNFFFFYTLAYDLLNICFFLFPIFFFFFGNIAPLTRVLSPVRQATTPVRVITILRVEVKCFSFFFDMFLVKNLNLVSSRFRGFSYSVVTIILWLHSLSVYYCKITHNQLQKL